MAVFHLVWVRRSWFMIMVIKSPYYELAFSSNIGFAIYQCPFATSPCFITIFHCVMKGISVTFFILDWTTWTAACNRQNQLLVQVLQRKNIFLDRSAVCLQDVYFILFNIELVYIVIFYDMTMLINLTNYQIS